MQSVIEELINALGHNKVIISDEVLRRYSRDFWPLLIMREQVLNEELPRPFAVIVPESVNDVSLALRVINESSDVVPVVVYGGGSSVTGASYGAGSIIIDMSKLNRVMDINTYDSLVTVEAGARLRDVETRLNEVGYSLRHIPQSFNYATIGGLIATMSSGQYSTLYGNIEDMVINLEVVLPNGEVTWLRSNNVPRASTGPSLKYLFIGSEGMLGVITKAVLRIVPLPTSNIYGAYRFNTLEQGVETLRELMMKRVVPAVARLYDEQEASIRFGVNKPLLIIDFEGYYDDLVQALWRRADEIIRGHGGEYAGSKYFEDWLRTRFNVEEEIEMVKRYGLWFDTIEVSTTWSKINQLYRDFRESLLRVSGVVGVMAHISHLYINGACIYFTVLFKPDENTYWEMWNRAMEATLRNGGSISHHHGIGIVRSRWLRHELGNALDVLRSIKAALDSKGILNVRKGMSSLTKSY
ncbi:FAD-binding oxidoreductase [Vulcanisaeta sp. JCM 16159]|uniref:FAD-binding oxidoreductase n=1 Tax=Vulcanisaeta sp. JCM 16159 TaxID=1295371 RepID=UPI0006D120B9|nr:FAD-binding oxidoreductase [Vulcanisaeta sp. JCM 16159]